MYKEVQDKSARVAEYFCDERSVFLEKVFEEMWQFMESFMNAVKVSATPSGIKQLIMYMCYYC